MAAKPHASDWRNARPLTKHLALVALLAVVGGVFLVSHFSAGLARSTGPTMLARNAAGEFLLANATTLFLVDAGQPTLRRSVEDLGLRGPVLSVATDGQDWYVGDDATGMLYRCDVRGGSCVAALRSRAGERMFRRAHHVAFSAGRLFITDAESHRLLTFDRDGKEMGSSRTGPLELCFPNGIVAADESLYIADTNNFRIARLLPEDPARSVGVLNTVVGRPIERANCNTRSSQLPQRGLPFLNKLIDSANTMTRPARPPARPGRAWPASLLRTSTGEWWVIQMDNRMRMGDVIRYGADGLPRGRIQLPAGADPIALIEAQDHVLVADAALGRVHSLTLQGQVSGAWGPADFRAMLDDIGSESERAQALLYISFGVVGLGVLAAILVVISELRRQRAERWPAQGLGPVTMQPGVLGRETLWIPLEPEALRRARRAMAMLALYLLGLLGFIFYTARDLRLDSPIGRFHAFVMTIVVLGVVAAGVLGALALARLAQRRLGVTHERLRYDPGTGDIVDSRWEDVRVSPRGMLVGRHIVQIIDPKGRYLYAQSQIESQLLSRMPPAAFLKQPGLMLESLRRGNVSMWVAAAAIALYAGLEILRISQPALLQRLGQQFVELFR